MAESITVIKTNWQSDEGVIKSVRMPVFVQEQQVPYKIDFDSNNFAIFKVRFIFRC